jgi:glyoxylase-like metal-dependent hydrolase (beta-lactamase superfamily II)
VACFNHPKSDTCTYVVWDSKTLDGVVIDCAVDYTLLHNRIEFTHCTEILEFIRRENLNITYILETHVHADHITGAPFLKSQLASHPKIGIGARISEVQRTFTGLLNLSGVSGTGSEFDSLFADNQVFSAGSLTIQVMNTPGHTPACVCYRIGDAVFTGDTIFHNSIGTARCDFPGGSAADLYASVQRILALPVDTRVFWGHDYPGSNRERQFKTSIADIKASNKQVNDSIDQKTYIAARMARDAQLNPPGLLYPSLQLNVRAGELPEPESNNQRYIKLPLFSN